MTPAWALHAKRRMKRDTCEHGHELCTLPGCSDSGERGCCGGSLWDSPGGTSGGIPVGDLPGGFTWLPVLPVCPVGPIFGCRWLAYGAGCSVGVAWLCLVVSEWPAWGALGEPLPLPGGPLALLCELFEVKRRKEKSFSWRVSQRGLARQSGSSGGGGGSRGNKGAQETQGDPKRDSRGRRRRAWETQRVPMGPKENKTVPSHHWEFNLWACSALGGL